MDSGNYPVWSGNELEPAGQTNFGGEKEPVLRQGKPGGFVMKQLGRQESEGLIGTLFLC
jgi:hypothetical protein